MGCSGLHCAGCAGGVTVPVVPLAAVFGVAWIAGHMIEVIAVCGASGALAVLIVVALVRWGERQDARHAQLWAARKAALAPAPVTATMLPQAATGARPALEQHVHYHVHLGAAEREAARIIRTALPGQAGAAITEGES